MLPSCCLQRLFKGLFLGLVFLSLFLLKNTTTIFMSSLTSSFPLFVVVYFRKTTPLKTLGFNPPYFMRFSASIGHRLWEDRSPFMGSIGHRLWEIGHRLWEAFMPFLGIGHRLWEDKSPFMGYFNEIIFIYLYFIINLIDSFYL